METSEKFKVLGRKQKQHLIDSLCLKILAKEGVSWGYKIYRKLKRIELPRFLRINKIKTFPVYYSTVERSLQRLERRMFIKKAKELTKSKKGPPQKLCTLTLLGLLYLLEFNKESWGYIEEIAAKHADKLPLIFGKWEHFKRNHAEGIVVDALKAFCRAYVPYLYESKGLDKMDDFLREDLTRSVLYFHLSLITLPPLDIIPKISENRKQEIFELMKKRTFEWVKIWFSDEKLREYLIKELNYDERECRQRLLGIKLVKENIRKIASYNES
ncbi:MAG: hypothetical protein QXV37_02135 [Candidatus Jordarchaeaceae archaeon]